MLRRASGLLAFLLLPTVLSGCSLWGASQAAANLLPLVTADDAPPPAADSAAGDPYADLVDDPGSAWTKQVLTADGRPFRASSYRPGQDIRVRWTVPVEVGGSVEAVAALAPRGCRTSMPEPSRWSIVYGPEARPVGEAWYVGDATGARRVSRAGRKTLGTVRAEALAAELGLPARERLTWVLVAPRAGRYHLVAEWAGDDPARTASARPCIDRWSPVPLSTVMGATSTTRHTATAPTDPGPPPTTWTRTGRGAVPRPDTAPRAERGASTRTGDVDAGVSLDPSAYRPDSSPADTASRPPAGEGGATPPSPDVRGRIADELQLLGRPAYDLVRLHQAALTHEVSAGSAGRYDAEQREALRALRRGALRSLERVGERQSCRLAAQRGLTERPLALWGGAPTVPSRHLPRCG